jgi:hypothetical protein
MEAGLLTQGASGLAPFTGSTGALKRCPYVHPDEKLVLNHEYPAPAQSGEFHERHLCAAKRECQRGGLFDVGREPEPSINPQRATSVMVDWRKAMNA